MRQSLASIVHLKTNPLLFAAFIFLTLVGAFYQGSYHVLMTLLPPNLWGMQESGVSLMYALDAVGILVGVYFYNRFLAKKPQPKTISYKELVFFGIASATYVAVAIEIVPISATIFLLFMVCFEVAFLRYYMLLIELCPQEVIGRLSTIQVSLTFLLIALLNWLTGLLVDYLPLLHVLLIINASILILALLTVVFFRRKYRTSVSCSRG